MKIKFLKDLKIRNLNFKMDSVFEGVKDSTIINLNEHMISIVINDMRYDINKEDVLILQ